MKKRILSLLLVVCLMASFASVAWAADDGTTETTETTLSIVSMVISAGGKEYPAQVNSGSMYLKIPGSVSLTDCSLSLETSVPVTFVKNTASSEGELYVKSADSDSATLNFNASVGSADLNSDIYGFAMSSEDKTVWNGKKNTLASVASNFVDIKLSSFATSMAGYENLGIAAGSIKTVSGDQTNAFWRVICNQDNEDVVLTICEGTCETYKVTYDCGNTTYVWELPANAPLVKPSVPLATGATLEGWYTDSDYETVVTDDAKVTQDITLYAKINGATGESFANQITGSSTVLTISTLEDFEVFAQRANEISADRRVVLGADIDCTGKTYPAITFAGDFDGQNHKITGATFSANGTNSGMFASIGAGQIIANLKLYDCTAAYAENAGILAGTISASNGSRALIQNVQVENGTVSGRNVGALVGYTFLSDIKYCSSRNVSMSGLTNVGGIAGISYSNITYCYSTSTIPSSTLWRKTGGIVAKNLEASNVQWCWCYASAAVGYSGSDSQQSNNVTSAEGKRLKHLNQRSKSKKGAQNQAPYCGRKPRICLNPTW
jgi:hypothetical protein